MNQSLKPDSESSHTLGKHEANRRKKRGQIGTSVLKSIVWDQLIAKTALFLELASALLRAVLVGLLVVTPSLILPSIAADTAQIVVVMALLASSMTFIEYYGRYPSFVAFRFAPPFNRMRYLGLFVMIVLLSLVSRAQTDPTGWILAIANLGSGLGHMLDFPFSPVRLVILMIPEGAPSETIEIMRTSAGLSYTVSILMVFAFLLVVRVVGWPLRQRAFHLWANLPLIDPTGGGDVLQRLRRESVLNILLGCLLPFWLPAALRLAADFVDPGFMSSSQTLVWTITAWAFLPASMLMRGIAMRRVVQMIEDKRSRTCAQTEFETSQRA